MTAPRTDRGVSLIELVVAMAIFALVAIMGVQSLSSMLRVRDALVVKDTQTTALGNGLATLRNDLSAIAPMLFFPPNRGAPASAVTVSGSSGVALSASGQPSLGNRHQFHRIEWRVDQASQTLNRRVWTTLIPADASALQPEVNIMTGVTAIRVRSYWPTIGWIDGVSIFAPPADAALIDGDSTGSAAEVYSDLIPPAIEVTLTTLAYGDITLIESLR